jgi:hypothetical protein
VANHSASLAIDISANVIGAAAVVGFAKDIVGAASDAEQAMGAVDAVFKENGAAIKAWSDQSAKSLGLSKTDYATLATTIGAQLKNAGTSMDDLAPKTNDLITLGADLAAQYGGSTSDAVEALSSVFKGETDPIEKYGVSIKQSDIAAQKAAMGMANLTGEADKQATAQATLALLTKQTADATGANAREADTAAGKQARLTAAWDDASAKMGEALLPAFSGLMDAVTNLIPVVTPLVSTIGDLVTAAAGLPAPLLAAGAGLAVFLKYSDGLSTAFKGMRSGALSAGEGFKAIGKSLAIGGAIGLAATALTTIIGAFSDASRHAQELRDRTQELSDTLVESGGKWTQSAEDLQRSQFKTSNGWKLAQQAGISFGDAFDLATGKMENQTRAAELLGKADDYISNWDRITHSDAAAGLDEINGGLAQQAQDAQLAAVETQAYNDNQKGMAAINAAAGKSITELVADFLPATKSTADLAAEHKKASEAAHKHADALIAFRASAADAAAAQTDLLESQLTAAAAGTDLQTALDKSAKAADDTNRAVSGLNVILDTFSGHSRSADDAAADLNASFLDMETAAKAAAKSGDLDTSALAKWNVKALTANQTGQDVYQKLEKVRDAYTTSTASAYAAAAATKGVAGANRAARDAAQSAYDKFVKMAGGLGLTDGQARTLATSLGIVEGKKLTDKEMKLIAHDKAAKDAVDNFNKKQLADKNAKIKAHAETTQAKSDLDEVAAYPYRATVTLTYQQTPHGADPLAATPTSLPGGGGGPPLPLPTAFTMTPYAAAPPGGGHATVNATPTVNITIQGAVDPDRTARQVRGILAGRERRTAGVRVGGLAVTP